MISGGAVTNRAYLEELIMVFVILLCTLDPSCGLAQTSVVITAEEQFQFAENYFDRGDYYKAIGEFERFIHFFPKEPRVESARYKIALAYLKGRRFKDSIHAFSGVIQAYPDTELACRSYFKIAECYVELGATDEALGTLDKLLEVSKDQDIRDEALYRGGWVFLERNEWEKARAAFDEISPRNRDAYRLQALSEEINQKDFIETKNPTTAGLLALIPGLGHLYCERYRDALVSFFLNGAMILAAAEAFDNENEALGGLLSLFEIGLYSGNIYSAVNSAHKYNRKQRLDFFNYLKEHAIVEVSGLRRHGEQATALCLQIAF
jgi:tetratricopeptide (TPR) repeat protein